MATAPPNGSEFCCRTGPLTNHRRYPTSPAACPDGSNSLLDGLAAGVTRTGEALRSDPSQRCG
jgi:hypothetical protein